MKIQTICRISSALFLALFLNSCGVFNMPANSEKSTLGEVTGVTTDLKNLPAPKEKIVVGVYKFRDQTGQYKASETGSNWSTAIPQGTTTILIKALEDSKWFIPIERENIANLLNERQIIRSTRQEYGADKDKNNQSLPPLLFAGILLEGGVISYDTNVMTGGLGARYFGIGASTQYRQDRITVYLRAVSTLNGEILKTVYTSKNILSTSVNGNFFRYIDTERLLESEIGFTQNEPVQLAVTEAIEKAVKSLIIEGIQDKIWGKAMSKTEDYKDLIDHFKTEEKDNETRLIGNKRPNSIRQSSSLTLNGELQKINGDYVDPETRGGAKIGYRFYPIKNISFEIAMIYTEIANKNIVSREYFGWDFNTEYMFFPQFKFTPFAYAGIGILYSNYKPFYKANLGGGLDYLFSNRFSLKFYTEYDLGFQDKLDGLIGGKQNDNLWRFGLGINLYFGKQPH